MLEYGPENFPNENYAEPLTGMHFSPSKKLAKLVADCPDLAAKIENKEEGYTYPTISADDARLDIFMRIAEEYHKCK